MPMKDNVPKLSFPWVTVALIAINLAVFGWLLLQPTDESSSLQLARAGVSERDQVLLEYGAIPYRITHPGADCGVAFAGTQQVICDGAPRPAGFSPLGHPEDLTMAPWWLTLLTSMFLGAGLLNIVVNMIFLWIFGNTVEDRMGHGRFLLFYLLAGIVASYGQALVDIDSTVPIVGTSGAIAGLLGAYLVLHREAKVLTFVLVIFFFTFIEIPSILFAGAWMALQFLPAIGQLATGEFSDSAGIYVAHVAGFLFGLAAVRLFAKRDRPAAELGEAVPG
jgi:membrane associated rhomboid family serine protease